MQVGVILPNWIGDVVMATPSLRALRTHFGDDATITGVIKPQIAPVLAGTPWLDQTIHYDRRAGDRKLRTASLVAQLRQLQLDKLLVLTNSFRSGAIAWLSCAKERYGYARSGRGWLLNRRLYPPRQGFSFTPISAVDYYLQLAAAAGCREVSKTPQLATLAEDELAADRVWSKFDFAPDRPVVALNTGGAYGAAKHWPAEYAAVLARRIADELHAAVLVLCGPAEIEAAQSIEQLAQHRLVRSLAGEKIGIGLSKACIARSAAMISTDSGPRHFAAAFGVPAVALFGPTDARWAINYHPDETHLHVDLPCRPCARRVCPLAHHRCMRDLTVDRVFGAVAQRLARKAQRRAA